MQLAILGAIGAAILAVAFAMQNNVPVTVTVLVWRLDSTLAMVLLVALGLGAIIVALMTTPLTLKRQWQIGNQKRHVADLERQCQALRTRIAELEAQIPEPMQSDVQKPYVGLKQLLVGSEQRPPQDQPNT